MALVFGGSARSAAEEVWGFGSLGYHPGAMSLEGTNSDGISSYTIRSTIHNEMA